MSSVGERIDSDESFHSQIIDAFKECARERSWRTSCAMQRNKMPNVGAVSLLSDRLIKRCHYYPTKDIKDEIANVCVSSGATYNVVLHDGSPDTLLAVNVTVILVFPYEKQNGYRRFTVHNLGELRLDSYVNVKLNAIPDHVCSNVRDCMDELYENLIHTPVFVKLCKKNLEESPAGMIVLVSALQKIWVGIYDHNVNMPRTRSNKKRNTCEIPHGVTHGVAQQEDESPTSKRCRTARSNDNNPLTDPTHTYESNKSEINFAETDLNGWTNFNFDFVNGLVGDENHGMFDIPPEIVSNSNSNYGILDGMLENPFQPSGFSFTETEIQDKPQNLETLARGNVVDLSNHVALYGLLNKIAITQYAKVTNIQTIPPKNTVPCLSDMFLFQTVFTISFDKLKNMLSLLFEKEKGCVCVGDLDMLINHLRVVIQHPLPNQLISIVDFSMKYCGGELILKERFSLSFLITGPQYYMTINQMLKPLAELCS